MPASPTTRKDRPRPPTASSRPARSSTSSYCRPTKTDSVRWWGGGIAEIIPLSCTHGKDGMPLPASRSRLEAGPGTAAAREPSRRRAGRRTRNRAISRRGMRNIGGVRVGGGVGARRSRAGAASTSGSGRLRRDDRAPPGRRRPPSPPLDGTGRHAARPRRPLDAALRRGGRAALPVSGLAPRLRPGAYGREIPSGGPDEIRSPLRAPDAEAARRALRVPLLPRSEEHTSELQSHHDLVCRLLLEKKKKKQ